MPTRGWRDPKRIGARRSGRLAPVRPSDDTRKRREYRADQSPERSHAIVGRSRRAGRSPSASYGPWRLNEQAIGYESVDPASGCGNTGRSSHRWTRAPYLKRSRRQSMTQQATDRIDPSTGDSTPDVSGPTPTSSIRPPTTWPKRPRRSAPCARYASRASTHAVTAREKQGVWGGRTEKERRRLIRQRRKTA